PVLRLPLLVLIFLFTALATTEIYTLSLHDALPILQMIIMITTAAVPPAAIAATSVCVAAHRALSQAITMSATFLVASWAACAACFARRAAFAAVWRTLLASAFLRVVTVAVFGLGAWRG